MHSADFFSGEYVKSTLWHPTEHHFYPNDNRSILPSHSLIIRISSVQMQPLYLANPLTHTIRIKFNFTVLSTPCRMLKQTKKSKQAENEDFDDMLAELAIADCATANNTARVSATSSSSTTTGTGVRPSVTTLPNLASENAAGRFVSEDAIVSACTAANLAQLRRWRRQGVRVRTAKPLLEAVVHGASFEVLSCLVKELGADVDQRDERGSTALTTAAYLGLHHIVRYLAEELGGDVNILEYEGFTPLYLAAHNGDLALVRILLKLGADIDRRNRDGSTPLMVASFKKYQEVVKWLVTAGADTQIVDTHDNATAADISRVIGASAEQTAYLEAKTHCSSPDCSGAGVMKCTGCKQARYCGEACQLPHWKAHKADCKRWSAELAAGKVN
jgi:hypothetical protein